MVSRAIKDMASHHRSSSTERKASLVINIAATRLLLLRPGKLELFNTMWLAILTPRTPESHLVCGLRR